MDVSKNRGTFSPQKWMVKISWFQPYEQMDDLGVFPIFLETPICPECGCFGISEPSTVAPLTNNTWKTSLSFWDDGKFSGVNSLLNFQGVHETLRNQSSTQTCC